MRLALAGALLLSLAACSALHEGPPLAIETGIHPHGTCPGAETRAIGIEREGDAAVFVDAGSSTPIPIVWPIGFTAWLIEGQATLYASDGGEVVRSGGTTVDVGGTAGGPGKPFRVCSVGFRTYN